MVTSCSTSSIHGTAHLHNQTEPLIHTHSYTHIDIDIDIDIDVVPVEESEGKKQKGKRVNEPYH